MANPSRVKGQHAEALVVDFLRRSGYSGAERRALEGTRDRGDINVAVTEL